MVVVEIGKREDTSLICLYQLNSRGDVSVVGKRLKLEKEATQSLTDVTQATPRL